MRLADIIEQKAAVQTLQRAVEVDAVAHAYLFHGSSGIGKTTTAVSFAKQILCETKSACGQCSECLKFERKNHPGLRMLEPDGAAIKIDQIRVLREQVQYANEYYQIWIIKDAHQMTVQAANSFLKLLEEPPQRTVFILVTDNFQQILPTIKSRCQMIGFRRLSDAAVAQALENRTAEVDRKKLALITKMAQGSIGKALELWDSPLFERRKWVIEQLVELPRMSVVEVLGLSMRWEENRDLFDLDLRLMLQWYRDLWCLKQGLKEQVYNIDYLNELSVICQKYNLSALRQITAAIVDIFSQLERNARIRFLVGNLLLQMRKGVLA